MITVAWRRRGRRVHAQLPALIEARDPQGIVRQHLAHDREFAEQFQRTIEICALRVRTVGNAFVNNQHRESPFCLRRFWASTPAATTSLRAHSYAHSALVGRLNRMCCDDSVGWLTETLSGVAFRAQPTRNGRTLARASLDIAGRSEGDLSMSITVTAPPRTTAGRRAGRAAVRRGRASTRSATSRSRRSPDRRRARERTT